MSTQQHRLAPGLDPWAPLALDPPRTRAFTAAAAAGAARSPGPGADDPAVAELYQGMRDADADLAARLEGAQDQPGAGLTEHAAHALTRYAFRRAVDEHVFAAGLDDPLRRARAYGARNAYAVAYAGLALRDVDHMDAPDVADRLVDALTRGTTDQTELTTAAWDAPFPISPSRPAS